MSQESTVTIQFACGHRGEVVERCAQAYQERYCDSCAKEKLPKPSHCLRELMKLNGDWLGPMLGPVGAVIYIRQREGHHGMLAWSGSETMLDILDGFESTREISPYIKLFEEAGL